MINDENLNLIDEFFNLTEEEIKLINIMKDEFTDFKFFNYGSLIYFQNDEDMNSFPHISDLLENYEKIFSQTCYKNYLVLRLTKYYITHNDGFIVISDNGYGSHLNIFKIKNVLIMYNIAKNQYKNGNINLRILKILKKLNII